MFWKIERKNSVKSDAKKWFKTKKKQDEEEEEEENTNRHTDFFNGTDSSHMGKKKDSENDKARCPDSSEVGASATSDYTITTGSDGAGPPRFRSQRHRTPPWCSSHTLPRTKNHFSKWNRFLNNNKKPKLKKENWRECKTIQNHRRGCRN